MESNIETKNLKEFFIFKHQTSGHSCFLKVSNSFEYILKPHQINEQKFYEAIQSKKPKTFSDFIPKYYGIYCPTPSEIKYFSELAKNLIVKDLKKNNKIFLKEGEENPQSVELIKKSLAHKSFLQKLYSERFDPQSKTSFIL